MKVVAALSDLALHPAQAFAGADPFPPADRRGSKPADGGEINSARRYVPLVPSVTAIVEKQKPFFVQEGQT
jgi:hypothetical protein